MKAERLVTEAIQAAQARGIKIVRGAVFNWCDPQDPYKKSIPPSECNAIGAVLLALGKEQLLIDGFPPKWLDCVKAHLDVDDFWVWRFYHGFDRGNCLTFTYTKDGKDYESKDDVSCLGDRLARKLFK